MDYERSFKLNEVAHSFQIFFRISWKLCGWPHFISYLRWIMSYPWFSLKLIQYISLSWCQILIINICKHIELYFANLSVLLDRKRVKCLTTPDTDIVNKIIHTFLKLKLLFILLLLKYYNLFDALIFMEGKFHINEL